MPARAPRFICYPVLIALLLGCLLALGGCATLDNLRAMKKDRAMTVADAYYGRAMSYRDSGRLQQAADDLQRAISEDPNMYQAYYQLGRVYEAQNKQGMAKQTWVLGISRVQQGPEREDYSRARALAEMRAALAGKEVQAQPPPPPPAPRPATAQVRSTPLKPSPLKQPGGITYAVLFSSNQKLASAQADQRRLSALGYKAVIRNHQDLKGKSWRRVWVGCCTSKTKAQGLARELKRRKISRDAVVLPFSP